MANDDTIEIQWELVDSDDHEAWDWTKCLYAYLVDGELMYIGMCYGPTSSIATRWLAQDKDELLGWAGKQMGATSENVAILAGHIEMPDGCRISQQWVEDLESLLILREQPPGNIRSTRSRSYARKGTQVKCTGDDWPGKKRYRDA